MFLNRFALTALLLTGISTFSFAEELSPEVQQKIKSVEESLKWQQGKVTLRNGLAQMDVPNSFRYLNHENAEKVLKLWGNEDVGDTLGMLFPAQKSPFADDGWGVVITYDDQGHVKDDDAREIDYNKLLSDMQGAIAEENKERKDEKTQQIELIGWATPPKIRSGITQNVLGKGTAI